MTANLLRTWLESERTFFSGSQASPELDETIHSREMSHIAYNSVTALCPKNAYVFNFAQGEIDGRNMNNNINGRNFAS